MSNVVDFKRPEKPDPHLSGEAVCIACRHTWVAVAPLGTDRLECPECHTMKGLFRYPVSADAGDSMFYCSCDSEALVAYYRKGKFRIQCMNCGTHQTDALFL